MSDGLSAVVAHRGFTVRDYFVVSTVISAFGLIPIAKLGESYIYLGYFLITANIIGLLLLQKLVIHRYHFFALVLISAISLVAASQAHYSYGVIFSQMIGIAVFSVYYYSIMCLKDRPIRQIFELYCRICVWISVIGILKWYYVNVMLGDYRRLESFFAETPAYIFATLPALSYMLLRWRDRQWWLSLAVMIAAYVLADTTLGLIGILITLFFMAPRNSIGGILGSILCVVVLFGAAYELSSNVRMRVDDTLRTKVTSDVAKSQIQAKIDKRNPNASLSVEESNASTLALMSNAYVAYRSFLQHPLIGTGIGTHRYSYDVYAPDVLDPTNELYNLNQTDACSLFLRLTSETGLFGLLFSAFFVIYFFRVRGTDRQMVRDAIIPCYVVYLIRYGNYFSFTLDFFAVIYVFNYLEYIVETRGNATTGEPLGTPALQSPYA